MKTMKCVRRWTVKILGLLLLVSALFMGGTAMAQGTSPAQMPKMTYTKNTIFHLPVQMDDRTRANLREVCLYVKSGMGDWVRQEIGQPTMTHFSYQVPRDGEYWFSLVTVDKAGKMTPADVGQEPPGLRVMVDTQPPVIDVQPWTSPEGDFCLRCQVQDANPDQHSLKATYRDQAGEHVVEPMPGSPNLFKIVGRDILNQPLHLAAADLCGNVASREVNVKDMVVTALQANKNANTKLATGTAPTEPTTSLPPPIPTVPLDTVRTDVQKPALPSLPPLPDKNFDMATGILPPPVDTNSNVPPLGKEITLTKATMPGTPGSAPKQIINTTHATIDYRIDQVGPSGVGKVEVYLTGDGGMVWQRLQEDSDRRSPAEVELPGEGLFGIRLVITNGNGFGGTPPVRGDAPTCWIEVDSTPPFVQLRPIDPAQNGVMELRWLTRDKNLGGEPVSLYYKNRMDGPWQMIAKNVKDDGKYRWTFPRDQGSQFFVKVEVTDLAGNTAHAETPNAIVLDITEPHASVVGVTGLAPRATPPTGN